MPERDKKREELKRNVKEAKTKKSSKLGEYKGDNLYSYKCQSCGHPANFFRNEADSFSTEAECVTCGVVHRVKVESQEIVLLEPKNSSLADHHTEKSEEISEPEEVDKEEEEKSKEYERKEVTFPCPLCDEDITTKVLENSEPYMKCSHCREGFDYVVEDYEVVEFSAGRTTLESFM